MMMPMFGLVGGLGAAIIIYLFSWKNGKLGFAATFINRDCNWIRIWSLFYVLITQNEVN